MKLRNKKTGGVDDFKIEAAGLEWLGYTSLREFCEDYEDYEEPKEFFAISPYKKEGYEVFPYDNFGHIYELAEELGIAFKTREETEKAVEKLKAITRLNKCGFKFEGYTDRDRANGGDIVIYAHIDIPHNTLLEEAQPAMLKDLDLLFNEQEYIRKKAQKVVEDNADYYDKFGGEE